MVQYFFYQQMNSVCQSMISQIYYFEMLHFSRLKNQEYVVTYKSDIQLLSIKVNNPATMSHIIFGYCFLNLRFNLQWFKVNQCNNS